MEYLITITSKYTSFIFIIWPPRDIICVLCAYRVGGHHAAAQLTEFQIDYGRLVRPIYAEKLPVPCRPCMNVTIFPAGHQQPFVRVPAQGGRLRRSVHGKFNISHWIALYLMRRINLRRFTSRNFMWHDLRNRQISSPNRPDLDCTMRLQIRAPSNARRQLC